MRADREGRVPKDVPDALLDRRSLLRRSGALLLTLSPLSGLISACGMGDRRDDMMRDGEAPAWMMSGGMDPQMMRDMPVIHDLLTAHNKIRREVEDVPGGIRAVTTSEDPNVAGLIRTHVFAMRERVADGRPIRQMDPLFREIFEHYRRIDMHVENVPDGVRVVETSRDPQVAMLIRQHARRAVSEFVRDGMDRAMEPTPLPRGYRG
jgi:hypothetical protein